MLILPIKFVHKSQQYNPDLPFQSLTTTCNVQTLWGLDNLKIEIYRFKKILNELELCIPFRGYGSGRSNYLFAIEYICQILFSLIQQHFAFIMSEKQDRDIFNIINRYRLNIDYTNILIEYYIEMIT